MKTLLLVVLLLGLPAPAQEVEDPVARLEAEFEQAHDAWKKASREARRADVPRDERPADPTAAYWPRFLELFEGGEGRAALWLLDHARDAFDRDVLDERVRAVAAQAFERHPREAWLEELCLELDRDRRSLDAEAVRGWLAAWRTHELPPSLLAASHWLEAQALGWDRRARDEHAAAIEEHLRAAVIADADSELGWRSGAKLFQDTSEVYDTALRKWLERPLDSEEESDLVDLVRRTRPRMASLEALGVRAAELWMLGTRWADEPDADLWRLEELQADFMNVWNEAMMAGAEQQEGPFGRSMMLSSIRSSALFWPAFETLAETEPEAGIWLVSEASSQVVHRDDAHRERALRLLERLAREHDDAAWAEQLAQTALGSMEHLDASRIHTLCEEWASRTTNDEVASILRFGLAEKLYERDREAGAAALRACIERWPDSKLAARARSRLSAPDLSIGSVAPDIVGEDLDGVEFKLSDYRGKVVVLDFWGDW